MKIMPYIAKSIIVALLFLNVTCVFAQDEQGGDNIDKEVTFVGDLELFLRDANKISDNPKIRESVSEMLPIQYKLIPNKLNAPFEVKPIPAAKINLEEKLSKLYRGYVRGGFGLYTTPFLDASFTDGRSRKGTFGLRYRHLSSAGNVAAEDSIPDRFSDNEFNFWLKKFLPKHSISANVDWERNVIHYYGFLPDSFPNVDIDGLKQRFNAFDAGFSLNSYFRDSTKINYDAGVKFYHFSDQKEGKEINFDVAGNIRKYADTELFSMDLGLNYNAFDFFDQIDSLNRDKEGVILKLVPKASTQRGNLQVSVGMGIMIDGNSNEPFHFYPMAEANYGLFDNILVPYAGVRGDIDRQTYRDLTSENPYITTSPRLRNRNERLNIYGGLRGRISSDVSFNAEVSNTNYEDFAYYVNDTVFSSTNQFSIVYDDLSILNFSGELSFDAGEKIKFFGRGDYNIYTTDKQNEAWHQPGLKISAGGVYNLKNKLLARAEIYQMGKRKALSMGPVEGGVLRDQGGYVVDLKGYLDMNLEVEYRYNKRLSIYTRLNNFLAAKYAVWNNYRVQRFNAMMGLTFAF
jgi:hypothetical protein